MTWNELLEKIPVITRGGDGNPVITDIVYDSRKANKNSVFVSIPGFRVNGDAFIEDAISRGACAILTENKLQNCMVPWAQVKNVRQILGLTSKYIFNIDNSNILFVGITGTNGKTTTTYLINKMLSLVNGELYTWMFGTVCYSYGDNKTPACNTTPESAEIFRIISSAKEKPKAIVMEVSSHSLSLDRIYGILYDCAVFTNLTQDHLDFHKTMENYYQAKKMLFERYLKNNGKAVINIDDEYGNRLYNELSQIKAITYGRNNFADICIVDWKCNWDFTTVKLKIFNQVKEYTSKLVGFFNVYNMTALVATAYALNINDDILVKTFEAIRPVPGRMERIFLDADFSVFVDYAHTPDALVNVLSTVKKLSSGRVICVFGCGGDRDKTKRPLMAMAVAQNADEAIITSDNPRSENPQDIIRDILQGMPLDFPHVAIADRREAIKKALSIASKGDCVVIAGKGHENYQEIKGIRYHFDDKEEIVKAFEELKKQ